MDAAHTLPREVKHVKAALWYRSTGRALYKKQYATPEARARAMVANARSRAQKRGLEFDIDFMFVLRKLRVGTCEATGLEFDYSPPPNGLHKNPYSPSLDRIDQARGYVKDNIRVVCTAFNLLKNQWSDDVMERVAEGFLATRRVKKPA